MTYVVANRLHNGDEVIDKISGEIVKVLSITKEPSMGSMLQQIVIEGIGDKQGYNHWYHRCVK